jgi:hypothetical protein
VDPRHTHPPDGRGGRLTEDRTGTAPSIGTGPGAGGSDNADDDRDAGTARFRRTLVLVLLVQLLSLACLWFLQSHFARP